VVFADGLDRDRENPGQPRQGGWKLAASIGGRRTGKAGGRILRGPTQSLAREAEQEAAKQSVEKTAARSVKEGDLVRFAATRNPSRKLSGAEMERLLRDALNRRPYLARLRRAGPGLAEIKGILKEWKDHTGKLYLQVTDGTVERLGARGRPVGRWTPSRARRFLSSRKPPSITRRSF
jgi:hypothetical protein